MSELLIDSIVRLIDGLFVDEAGSSQFNLSVGICVAVWLVVARVLLGMFRAERGLVAAFFALITSIGLGLVAYALAEVHLVDQIEGDWAEQFVPYIAFGLFVFLAQIVFAKRILAQSAGVTVFIFTVASAAAVAAYFGTKVAMGVIETGGGRLEKRENRVQEEIDALL